MNMLQSALFNNTVTMLSNSSMGQRMGTAALNTIIGLVTVFAVLILIIFLISAFKYIPQLQEKFLKKTVENNSIDSLEETLQTPEIEEVDYVDDEELVAVITAAIYAFVNEGKDNEIIPADSLVVRSIRKTHSQR